jgi:hypothetical protein
MCFQCRIVPNGSDSWARSKGVNMTKIEALKKAEAARHAAKLALTRHALYATTFGGNDQLTQAAMLDHDVALEAHNKWMDVAQMHPKTRASLIRNQSLPSWMFGY